MWDEPLTIQQAPPSGITNRLTTNTYDAAGRPATSATTASQGTPLPTVQDAYDPATGLPTTVCSLNAQGTCAQTISTGYDGWGRVHTYQDADGNTTTTTYDIDGNVSSVADGKGSRTFTYDYTTGYTGDLTTLQDSAFTSGQFAASYNADGALTSESYPNGLIACYTYDSTGQAIALSYLKSSTCTSGTSWYSDSVTPSIYGQWANQNTTLSNSTYTYDAAGRLTQAQQTPTSTNACTTRQYRYDTDSNRLSLTTIPASTGGACDSIAGDGVTQPSSYDQGDRLTDPGITYNAFGDIISLPASDAGGSTLTSTYYADNTTNTLTQSGETITNSLDPTGRTREQRSTGTTSSDITNHYSDSSDSPAWTIDTNNNWARDITGIDGNLAATQTNGSSPTVQLSNLHGDIVATASASASANSLLTTTDTTEYGVPTTGTPPSYGWLGAQQRQTELASGATAMGARTYIPTIGAFTQPDPLTGGGANAYGYASADPVNSGDPTGAYTVTYWGNIAAMEPGPLPASQFQSVPDQSYYPPGPVLTGDGAGGATDRSVACGFGFTSGCGLGSSSDDPPEGECVEKFVWKVEGPIRVSGGQQVLIVWYRDLYDPSVDCGHEIIPIPDSLPPPFHHRHGHHSPARRPNVV
jgi:RHS repeat-associated protein